MGRDFTPERIADLRVDIPAIAAAYGLRPDWHEPDEQGVSARVFGDRLDNAYGVFQASGEIVLVLYDPDKSEYAVNIADLLADYCRLVHQASGF